MMRSQILKNCQNQKNKASRERRIIFSSYKEIHSIYIKSLIVAKNGFLTEVNL